MSTPPSGTPPASTAASGELAAPARGFTGAEFETRLLRCHALMATRGFDALLLTTEPEIRYLSGFRTRFWESPARPWFLVVPATGKPIAVIPEIGAALMAKSWVDDIRTWPAPRPSDEGVSLLSATLRETVGDYGRVGAPVGAETTLRMPLTDYARLTAGLSGLEFGDATDVVRTLRIVKSEGEIAKIAHICQIASDAFSTIPQQVTEEQRLVDVFRDFSIELLRRGADAVPYLAGAAAPGGYDNIIAPPDERRLARGDVAGHRRRL